MKKTQNSAGFIQIILALVVIALVGGGMYYFGKMSNKSTITINSPTEEPAVIETQKPSVPAVKPTADPTANWKVYTNTVFYYSFKYPSMWSVGTKGQADSITAAGVISSNNCSYDKGELCQQIMITAEKTFNKNDLSPSFILDKNDGVFEKNVNLIKGLNSRKFTFFQKNYGVSGRLLSVIVVNNGVNKITLTYEESQKGLEFKSENDWKNEKLFDQILSTFKFTK